MTDTNNNNIYHVDSSITQDLVTPSSKRMEATDVVQVEVEVEVLPKEVFHVHTEEDEMAEEVVMVL
jgi:hypothetical protein